MNQPDRDKSLGQIAYAAGVAAQTKFDGMLYWNQIAAAVEQEVLERMSNVSGAAFQAPTPGTPLNHLEVLLWVKKHGSTKGLQLLCRTTNEWRPVDSTNICTNSDYRVAALVGVAK